MGLARRAIDETRLELGGKSIRFTDLPRLGRAEKLQTLEAAEGLLYAFRAGLERAMGAVWACALGGQPLDQAGRLEIRLAAITAVHQGSAIVRSVYDIADAGAVRRSGILQQLYRDASCLGHHVSANKAALEATGRLRAGCDPLNFRI